MALASLLPGVAMGTTGGYHLTAANTHISFEVRRLGLRLFSAEFHQLSGDFVLDGSPEGGAMGVVVQMGSIDCHDAGWNVRLRSPQWLDVEKYPEMTFHSRAIHFDGAHRATVEGELTLHGITKPLVFTFSDINCNFGAPDAARTCHFSGRAQIRRSDFRLPHGFWEGGDLVDIWVRGV